MESKGSERRTLIQIYHSTVAHLPVQNFIISQQDKTTPNFNVEQKHLPVIMMINSKIVPFLFLSISLLVGSSVSTDVLYCDRRADYDVKVHGVEISPYPVIKGQPATFTISATSGQPISGGKLVIDVSYFGVHIHSEVHDLCAETSCPVSTGDFLIAHSQVLPGFTPPGSYTLKMRMEDTNKHQLTCIGFDFSIGSASPVADS